tara:strand:- start:10002 stop:12992 length:2991 start_codon:yes stop_codon:yes gene_type:complete
MNLDNINNIKVILATDCGSTTTKAILIQKLNGQYRQTHRGEAPSTVEEPFADVTVGVLNAVTEVAELAGRKLINHDGKIITPAKGENGCDIYISTSSAGGGLQMMVAGVIREMTAASAKRAALGAGAIVMDVIASNDKRQPHEQIQRIRELRPDMILLSGGTDGGTKTHVVKIAELIAPAKPQPRFGAEYQLPLIYAGNNEASNNIQQIFKDDFELSIVENLRPTLEQENLSPARDSIHDLFLEHVMAHAPGYNKLIEWTDAPIMPTPGAVGNILQTIAKKRKINVVGVDIGGATTDVFSVFDGIFNRTVSANLGMSYSISNVCAEATMENIMRWIHVEMDERELRNRVKNKMIRPTTIPQSLEALIFEQSVAREALRLAYVQHKEFATTLKGIQQQRTVGDTFSQEVGGQTIVDNIKLDLLVASGGVLSHAPQMQQTAMMLIDSFQPEGITSLAKDSIFMMPHLGVLSQVHKQAAMDVFEKDCLIYLGTVVSPRGVDKKENPCFQYTIKSTTINEEGEMLFGNIKLFPLGMDEKAEITIQPSKAFDMGLGPGKSITKKIRGGTVGLIFDARGRPLSFADNSDENMQIVNTWINDLLIYPKIEINTPSKDSTKDSSKKAHAYTPGLQVTRFATLTQKRILPIPGKVLVKLGDLVDSKQIVAETFMPGDIFPINLANQLSMPPGDVPECVTVKLGEKINEGEILAETKGIFGMFKTVYKSPFSGTVETISDVTGQIILRGKPHPINIMAFMPGNIIEIIENQGVIIEADVSFIQGIFGIGGETFGNIIMACKTPDDELTADKIHVDMKNSIIIGGARMTSDAVEKAIDIGAAGIVSGGIDDHDLKDILGYDLGVAITGSEKLGITLIITEGFGDISMAEQTFSLFKGSAGIEASINGSTQIRAGVIRPSIVIPLDNSVPTPDFDKNNDSGILEIDSPVRIIRDPYFGKIGKVFSLPSSPQKLESGTKTRVLEVIVENSDILTVPRANIERIEGHDLK